MRMKWIGILVVSMHGAAPLFGQPPPAPPSAAVYQAPPLTGSVSSSAGQEAPGTPASPPLPSYVAPDPPSTGLAPIDPTAYRVLGRSEADHIWVRAELLAWWVKNAPLPVPIAVLTDANGNSQTAIGNTNTNYGAFSGGRFALGAWFDEYNNYGFETAFFSLERRSNHQALSSDDNGSPSIGLSYLSATPGQIGEYIQPLSAPGAFAADILVSSHLQLWGAEFNGAVCLLRRGGFELTTLAGFRYLDLQENLTIIGSSTDINSGDFFALSDEFSTHNRFYGGQVGARLNWTGGRFSLDATGKLALGTTHQSVDVQGTSLTSAGSFSPGGFYAQPSNMGHAAANQFGIIPSVELKFSYRITRSVLLFVGYDFLYWNQVVRPGNQIDRNVNVSQSSVLSNGILTGPALPGPLFNRSDFWAQGLTVGFEFRF